MSTELTLNWYQAALLFDTGPPQLEEEEEPADVE